MVGSCLKKKKIDLKKFRVGHPSADKCTTIQLSVETALAEQFLQSIVIPWRWRRFFRSLAFGERATVLSELDRHRLSQIGFVLRQRRVSKVASLIQLRFSLSWCHRRISRYLSCGDWPRVPARIVRPLENTGTCPCPLCS